VLNNLEFDHADIFDDLAMIQRQFHHLVRTVPGSGLIVHPGGAPALDEVLAMGCWTPMEAVGDAGGWSAEPELPDWSRFRVALGGEALGTLDWDQTGRHNMLNALAVLAAGRHAGVPVAQGIASLSRFQGVKRRMELRGEVRGVRVYDDFAHHPTAIATTLDGLRNRVAGERIIAVLEPRSNTMRMGVHNAELAAALAAADLVYLFAPPDLGWDAAAAVAPLGRRVRVMDRVQAIVERIIAEATPGDHVLVMSNGGFEGIHQRLLEAIQSKPPRSDSAPTSSAPTGATGQRAT
jgi:UDP-N-acetylmuramate: L-alanyl-gamma-D-glutamyl-meso-diaminopimelate ligase